MKQKRMTRRRGWLTALSLAMLGSALLAPQTAWADGDKGKDGKVPIIIKDPIITPDPPKTPPPPKK